MGRVSVPHIPKAILEAAATSTTNLVSLESVIQRVAAFVRPGNLAVLTGAGVSVDSGIRAYRGDNGTYMNPNYRWVLLFLFLLRLTCVADQFSSVVVFARPNELK
jgi:NAD-dependent deacetylase sirtuin 4